MLEVAVCHFRIYEYRGDPMSSLLGSSTSKDISSHFDAVLELENAQRAGDDLKILLDNVPSLKDMLGEKLRERFARLYSAVDVERYYITTGHDRHDIENRPSGSLLDVFYHCLSQGIYPAYIQNHDFVYSRPGTTDQSFIISGVRIVDVENLFVQALKQLASDVQTVVVKYWSDAAETAPVADASRLSVLQHALVEVLSAELRLNATAGVLPDYQTQRALELLRSAQPPAYAIRVASTGEFARELVAGFVLSYAGVVDAQIRVDGENLGWFLYTADEGFEYFSSSTQMHLRLCERQSVSTQSIEYPRLSSDVLSHYVESRFRQMAVLLTTLLKNSAIGRDGFIDALQGIQRLSAIHSDWDLRFQKLNRLVKRSQWPDWLKDAGQSNQQNYEHLEASRAFYEYEYAQEFAKIFSLRDYVLQQFSSWTQSALGTQPDPDTINVHSVYRMKVGGRTIEQEDITTLTEFIVAGLHDAGNRAVIRLEGAAASSGLTAGKLESWLSSRDVRSRFVAALPPGPSQMFHEACYNRLYSRFELALFVARHSDTYSDADNALINRAMAGDPAVLVQGVKLGNRTSLLKDVLVFSQRGTPMCHVFARMPDGEFAFRKFANDFALDNWLGALLTNDNDYAQTMIMSAELASAGQLVSDNDLTTYYLYKVEGPRVDLNLDPRALLSGYVDILYQFEVATCKSLAPIAYRSAGEQLRQTYARTFTELKALTMVDTRENGFPTFEQFSRDLVKSRVEEVLRSRGQNVQVDPDRIIVQTDEFHLDLTSIIVEGRSFEVPNTPGRSKDDNPKYYLKGDHPRIDKLDIRDLSSWSKTLRPGDVYTKFLSSDYLDKKSPGYAFKRAVHARKIRCEMHYDAMFQYFDSRLSQEVFKGIQRVVDGLEEHDGYKDYPLSTAPEGLYKFRPVSRRAVEGVYILRLSIYGKFSDYLYTPNAPDGTAYRPVEEFIRSIRFRYGPFRAYYTARVKLEDQKVVNDYFDKLVATVDTRAPLQPEGLARVFNLYTFHDDRVRRVLSDIDARTTSLNEVIAGLIYDNVIFAATIISLVIPPVGTAVTVVQLLKSVHDSAGSYRSGEYSAALGHAQAALVGLLSLGQSSTAQRVVKITAAQKTLFDLAQDARTVVGWMSQATGQMLGEDRLLEFVETLMKDNQSRSSKTTVL